MTAQAFHESRTVEEVPLPRQEWVCTSVPALRLGWSLYDPRCPNRDTPTQAQELGQHLSRRGFSLKQVHGTACVVLAESAALPEGRVEADGILTDRRDLLVGVSVADCLPLYLITHRAVAVLHAGWRGVLAGILPLAMQRLREEFKVTLESMEMVIGPGIGPCCFEVGPSVGLLFPAGCRVHRAGALYLDLARAVEVQWQAAGGRTAARRLDRCTRCSKPALHSYRRDGGTGRNFAYLYYS